MDFKQVIVVRSDLKMSKGKLAVQVAHASVISAFEAYRNKQEWFDKWWRSGQKKIVLKVGDEAALLSIYEKALAKGLPAALVRDAGLTELPPGTTTAVGIGPCPAELVDEITGRLDLL